MKQHAAIKIFAIITAIGAFVMLLMGSIVTKTGSGQGCGNTWPFCQGQLIPETMNIEAFFEYSHRIASSIDGMLILILTIWSWRLYQQDGRVKLYGFMSLFFVILQGGLGALTVMFSATMAKDALLALHFGFSLISFASVILLTVHLFQMRRGTSQELERLKQRQISLKALQYPVWGLLVYTYVVVYTGALVRHMHATMGCGFEFPGCGTTYFPGFSSVAGIHMLHRYAAISIWILMLCFLIVVIRRYSSHRGIVQGCWLAFILVTCQALSGISTVLMGGILLLALLHTTIISVFFSVLCYLCGQIGAPWKRKALEQEDEVIPVAANPG